MLHGKAPPLNVSGAGRRAQGGTRSAQHRLRNERQAMQVAAVPDLLHQLSTLDASSFQSALDSTSQLQAHFGTQTVSGSVTGLAAALQSLVASQPLSQQLLALGDGLVSTGTTQVLSPVHDVVGGAIGALEQQRDVLLSQRDILLSQLGGTVTGAVTPVTGAVQTVAEQLTTQLLPAGQTTLAPHWGTQAVQDALRHVTGSVPADWDSSLTGLTAGAGALAATAATAAGLQPVEALQAAAQQLGQAVQLFASAPQGLIGTSHLPEVVDDVRLVLAALPLPAASGMDLQPGALLPALPPAAVRLVERLALAAQQGEWAGHSLPSLLLAASAVSLAVGWSAFKAPAASGRWVEETGEAERELGYEYDPERLKEYLSRRPVMVMTRAATVASECATLGLALLSDLALGRLKANEKQRAEQLRFTIERLGPAYVKVAQAISTRVDLLTPEYFEQIQLLQDRVPPFPCSEARAAMVTALGRPVEEVFATLTDKPVAAASLGQVYRATLVPELGGGDVAVKVQRPGVLSQVALDLGLMRAAGEALSPNMSSDWVSIIDSWAVRFLHEMDYEREADNAERFQQDMAQLSGITVPVAVRSLSNHNVLTSRWVEGEKLCESGAPDVRALCNTLLSAYLVQLLDTGFLHADPHPGNLLRTPDGKIAVLDYGLMTEVTEAQRWALLEYIGHLSTRDWEAVARDLQVLGFIPPEVDPREKGLVEPLGRIMSQLVGGGGAAKVNIDKVVGELEELGKTYPFQIPGFFALILRAFSVIEGVALGVDPDYAIVAECFPYLSRRLLADDSPRARALLRDILYGGRQRLDIERLTRLADGFSSYTTDGLTQQTTTTSAVALPAPAAPGRASPLRQLLPLPGPLPSRAPAPARPAAAARPQPVIDGAVRDALLTVFSVQGSYVQELLVEEAAAAVDALSVSTLAALLMSLTGLPIPSASTPAPTPAYPVAAFNAMAAGTTQAAVAGTSRSGPLAGWPLLPSGALAWLQPLVQMTEEDREALGVVQGIMQLFVRAAGANGGAAGAQQQVPVVVPAGRASNAAALAQVRSVVLELGPLLPQVAPGLAATWRRFLAALVSRAQLRLDRALRGMPYSSAVAAGSGTAGSGATERGAEGTGSTTGQTSSSGAGAGRSKVSRVSPYKVTPSRDMSKVDPWSMDQLMGSGARISATAASQWRSPKA